MLEKLHKAYPNTKIELEGKGWHSEAYTVDDYIVRIPRHGDMSAYKKEEKILNFLKSKITFEIPQVRIIEEPFPHSIHKKLLGVNWTIEDYEKLAEKEKDLFASDVALFFAQLHSVNYGELESDFLAQLKLEVYGYNVFEQAFKDDFNSKEIDRIFNLYNKHFAEGDDRVLLHNDFWDTNSLMNNNNRLKAVFDFGNTIVANRAKEFIGIFEKDAHSDLYSRILKEYEKFLNLKVDLEEIKYLRMIYSVDVALWLSGNKEMKQEKQVEWLEHIQVIKEFIIIK